MFIDAFAERDHVSTAVFVTVVEQPPVIGHISFVLRSVPRNDSLDICREMETFSSKVGEVYFVA